MIQFCPSHEDLVIKCGRLHTLYIFCLNSILIYNLFKQQSTLQAFSNRKSTISYETANIITIRASLNCFQLIFIFHLQIRPLFVYSLDHFLKTHCLPRWWHSIAEKEMWESNLNNCSISMKVNQWKSANNQLVCSSNSYRLLCHTKNKVNENK